MEMKDTCRPKSRRRWHEGSAASTIGTQGPPLVDVQKFLSALVIVSCWSSLPAITGVWGECMSWIERRKGNKKETKR